MHTRLVTARQKQGRTRKKPYFPGLISVLAGALLFLLAGAGPGVASVPPPTPFQYSEQAIKDAYRGNLAILGDPKGPVTCSKEGYPCWRTFATGGLYVRGLHSGVLPVTGAVYTKWLAAGGSSGQMLGYPVGYLECDAGKACDQEFERGAIYTQGAGPGVIRAGDLWSAYPGNSLASTMGRPVADATCSAGPACTQLFERGYTYSKNNGNGTFSQGATYGPVYDYAKTRRPPLSGPSGRPDCTAKGCVQHFSGGVVFASPALGSFTMTGAIWSFYSSGPGPSFGWPTSEEQCGLANGGCMQRLEGGRSYWAPVIGPSLIGGGILASWTASGAERSALGYPLFYEVCQYSLCYQKFQSGGALVWSAGTGTQQTAGAIGAKFAKYASYLGAPTTSRETCGLRDGACYQQFAKGRMYWVPGVGTWPVRGGIDAMWRAAGAEKGSLRYPVGPEFCRLDGTGCMQTFQGGALIWGRGLGEGGGYAP